MFIKRPLHIPFGTFSSIVASRMVFVEMGAHAQEAAEASAERAREGGEKREDVRHDAQEKLAEHSDNLEAKRSALEKVAKIIAESPEDIEKAFYNYNLAEHDKANRTPKLEAQRIIDKIITAKKEGNLKGITFLYLGGTNGQRHDLNKLEKRMASEIKQWHEKKSEAFKNIIKGKNTIRPVELRTFIETNEDLIKEYQAKVGAGNTAALKTFLATNNSEFCDAGGLFDLALAYQRADDLYDVINEGKKMDPLKDVIMLDLRTGAGSEDLENCRSKLEFTMPEGATGEVQPQKPAQGEGVVVQTPPPVKGPNDLPEDHPEQLPPAPPTTFEKTFTGKIDNGGRLILTMEPTTPSEGKPTTYEVIAIPNIPGNPQLDIVPGQPENGHKTVEIREKTPNGPGRLYFRAYVIINPSGYAELVVINNPPDKNLKPQDEKPPEFRVVPNEKLKGTFIVEVVKSTLIATSHLERAPAPVLPEAKHFNDTGTEEKKYEKQLKDATEVLKGLDIETKKILTHLTPPVFSFMNSLQPKADSNGRYFVYIDIRNTPQDIKKNLENAAKMIVEEGRFLHNTPQENMAADQAREKGMPFKNIRQAYIEDLKSAPKINWNGPAGDPIAPYAWVENDQKDSEWFNYAVETPAETADRIRKNDKEKEVKRISDDEAKKIKDDEAAAKKAAAEEEVNKEADPEDVSKFKTALDAYNIKREAFNQANGLKLVSHLDAFDTNKGPYKLADIDEYAARLEGLSNGIDRFGKIFESMSKNTKNILKSVELIIDQEDEDRKDPESNISRNTDGSYRLWFDIARSEEMVKKDVISQKNKFVKGKKYSEDSPIEATQRASVGDTFRNSRQAYQEKSDNGKRCIMYDVKKDEWIPARNRKWAGTLLYDYSTVEIPEEPIVPTPVPKPEPAPNPKPGPEPAPEAPYEAASTDSIKISGDKITTKQMRNGKIRGGEITIEPPGLVTKGTEKDINIVDGKVKSKVKSLEIYEGEKVIGSVYLDKAGVMKSCELGTGYDIDPTGGKVKIIKKTRRH